MEFSIANYLQNRAQLLFQDIQINQIIKLEIWNKACLIIKRNFSYGKLITHRYKLEDIQQGFEDSINRTEGYIKGIITLIN